MKIRELRQKNAMTQKELAALLSVDQSAVSFWETGEAMPRASLLPKLAEALQCSIDELYAAAAPQEGV